MAAIQNERTLRLQATVPRIVPVQIPITDVDGLPQALKRITLEATAQTIYNTNPPSVTITATRHNGVSGTLVWSTSAGTLTGTGDSRSIAASSIPVGQNAVVQATADGVGMSIVINRAGALGAQSTVDLASQITGQLANSNVSGLGALALINAVNLGTTQVVGNLAADRIGVGTLAAGVIYAGAINADNITSGIITGRTVRTAVSGKRAQIAASADGAHHLRLYDEDNNIRVNFAQDTTSFIYGTTFVRMFEVNNSYPSGSATAIEARCAAGTAFWAEGAVGVRLNQTSGIGIWMSETGNAIGVQIVTGNAVAGYFRNTSSGKSSPDIVCGNPLSTTQGGLLQIGVRASNPTPILGGIAARSGVGPIWSDGTNWYTFSDNSIVT